MAKADLPKIIVICGPTGVGKTGVAIKLANRFNAEIIGADSMQVYKCMDIGSAKPTPFEQQSASHHMIDIIRPDTDFDAAAYSETAKSIIDRLIRKAVRPFIVGGTGLYIKALLYGLSRARPANPQTLEKLKAEAATQGAEMLHKRLTACDPEAAEKIHPNDTFRIIRALEIRETTGIKISDIHRQHRFQKKRFDSLKLCLTLPREHLYARIERRVDEMICQGFLEEVKKLREAGFSSNLKSMQSIGYRHMNQLLDKEITLDEAVFQMKRDTRRYAKRQLTWFQADPEMTFFEPHQLSEIEASITSFLDSVCP